MKLRERKAFLLEAHLLASAPAPHRLRLVGHVGASFLEKGSESGTVRAVVGDSV